MVRFDNSATNFLPLNITSGRSQFGGGPFAKTHLAVAGILTSFQIFYVFFLDFWRRRAVDSRLIRRVRCSRVRMFSPTLGIGRNWLGFRYVSRWVRLKRRMPKYSFRRLRVYPIVLLVHRVVFYILGKEFGSTK